MFKHLIMANMIISPLINHKPTNMDICIVTFDFIFLPTIDNKHQFIDFLYQMVNKQASA